MSFPSASFLGITKNASDRTYNSERILDELLTPSIVPNPVEKSLDEIMHDTDTTQGLDYDGSYDDEDTYGDVTYDSDDIIELYERQDSFIEFVVGKKNLLGLQKENLFRELCNIDIPRFFTKKQELRKKIKKLRLKEMLLNPVKSLVTKSSNLQKQINNRGRSNSDPYNSSTNRSSLSSGKKNKKNRLSHKNNLNIFRVDKRRRVSFVEEVEAPPSDTSAAANRHYTLEEIEAMWYNKDEYETMRLEALKASENFVANGKLTLGGTTIKEKIVEQKRYKTASRFVVFDEQEEQRVSKIRDPEKVRKLYRRASIRSLEAAQKTAAKGEEELRQSWSRLSAFDNDSDVEKDVTNHVILE